MYALAVTFQIDPAKFDAFMPLVLKNARVSLANEPGCRQFDVCTDSARAGEVFLYEVYDSPDAFKAHTKAEHYAEFQAGIEGMIVGKDVKFFSQVEQ